MPILNQLSFAKGRSEDHSMIEVRGPLEIKADSQGGWQLVFWVFEAFNFTTPFRVMLADIADALGQDPRNDLQLPAYEAGEDFVFGTEQLRVYYEHSLSYLTLTSDNEATLREVAKRIQPSIAII